MYETDFDGDFSYCFAIFLKDSNTFIGYGGFGVLDSFYPEKEVYYLLGKDYWGKGYATEMMDKTPELDVVIKNEKGDYVCCAGVSMISENNCAYLEPMCTISEYRNMGLGAAAISEAFKRTKPLGATHMTSGSNQFYFNLGFEGLVTWTSWKK